MSQDRLRLRDTDMWVDVKRKDNSNCIRSLPAVGNGNIAFPAERNNGKKIKNPHKEEGIQSTV